MKSHMKYWHRVLPVIISVLLVGCTGIGTTSSGFSTQSAARRHGRLTGSFAIHTISPEQLTDIRIGADLSKENGNRSAASGNNLVVLYETPTKPMFDAYCRENNKVVSVEVRETGKKFSFALSTEDGTMVNGTGSVAADGTIAGSYAVVGTCQDVGTFTAGRVGPLAGTYAGEVSNFSSPENDTITITLQEAADSSLMVTGTSQLIGPFTMTGFVAGNLFFMEGTLNGADIPVYGIYSPGSATSPAWIALSGPDGGPEDFIGNLVRQ